jgi:tRNA 2-thiouridine synthesizing protein D
MRYAIQVNASPWHSHSGYCAYRFIKALTAANHDVMRVFFFHEGIYHAVKNNSPPDDEIQLTHLWRQLAERYDIDLLVCVSAAQRRGLQVSELAPKNPHYNHRLAEGFRIGGLAQWLETMIESDRVIVFG